MNLCAKCGACSTVCPVYRVTGREELTARGKLHLLGKMAEGRHSAAYLEIFSRCLLCGACKEVCPRGIDLPALVVAARHNLPRLSGSGSFSKFLVNRCLAHPTLLAGLGTLLHHSGPLLQKLPADSGLRLKLGLFTTSRETAVPQESQSAHTPAKSLTTGVAVFGGCLARHLLPEVNQATEKLLDQAATPQGQVCCGLAAFSSGDLAEARRLARRNILVYEDFNGPIVTPCASCYSHLSTYPDLLAEEPEWQARARTFTARLRELADWLAGGHSHDGQPASPPKPAIRLLFHDPCHLHRYPELRQAVRRLLKARPEVELLELSNSPRCCGLGGTFNLAHPELSARIAQGLIEEIGSLAPDLVLTSCSGCLLQLHRQLARSGGTIPVRHLALFLADP
jgi:glycolate oxidase iron-sulfur subunit